VGVAAGEGIVAAPGIAASRHALVASNWTSGKLEFKATPLDAAVALANRYSKRKIIVEPGLGKLRVTGAFRAGDASGFSAALAEAFHLSAKQEANGNLLLSRGASGPP
jgi:transmembrane sensor